MWLRGRCFCVEVKVCGGKGEEMLRRVEMKVCGGKGEGMSFRGQCFCEFGGNAQGLP
jgi:hypothetical protein